MTINYKNTSSHGKISFKDTLRRIWEGTTKPSAFEAAMDSNSSSKNPKVFTAPGVSSTTDKALSLTSLGLGAASGMIPNPVGRLVAPLVIGLGDTAVRVSQSQSGDQSNLRDALSSSAMDTLGAYMASQGTRFLTKNLAKAEMKIATDLARKEASARAIEQIGIMDASRGGSKALSMADRTILQDGAKATRSSDIITPIADSTVIPSRVGVPGTVTVERLGRPPQTLGDLDKWRFNNRALRDKVLPPITVDFSIPQGGFDKVGPWAQKAVNAAAGTATAAAITLSKSGSMTTAPSELDNELNAQTYTSSKPDLREPNGWFNQFMANIFPARTTIGGKTIIPSSANSVNGGLIRRTAPNVRDQTQAEMDAVANRPPYNY